MVFYNFLRILKNCLFYLTRSFKYLGFSLLLVLVICVCLLLMTNKSNAETYPSNSIPQSLYDKAVQLNNTTSIVILWNENDNSFYIPALVNASSSINNSPWVVTVNGNKSYLISPGWNYQIKLYKYDLENKSVTDVSSSYPELANSWWLHVYGATQPVSYLHVVYASLNIPFRSQADTYYFTTSNNYTILSDNAFYNPFTAPALYPNASSSQSEQTALTSGNFTFFIVEPGSISSSQDILLQFYDTTNSDSANNVAQTLTLNENSPFYEESLNSFEYVITARFLPWFKVVNGMSYKARLSWVNPNNSLDTQHVDYTWTMSLTAEQQAIEEQKTQQDINQGINNLNNNINELNNTQNEINNFLNDDSFNSNTVTDSIPNSDSYSVPTYEGFDNIFTAFRNAFTTTETTSVRFVFPNSNGKYIDIPSNLVSSKLPQPLIIIIQAFYWFMICRFILKDISKTAEKTKSGEILDDRDGNIKTDLL